MADARMKIEDDTTGKKSRTSGWVRVCVCVFGGGGGGKSDLTLGGP